MDISKSYFPSSYSPFALSLCFWYLYKQPTGCVQVFTSLSNSNTKLSIWSLHPLEFTWWRKCCIFNPCLPPSQLLLSAAEHPVPNAQCLWCHVRLPAVDMSHQVHCWSSWSFDTGSGQKRTTQGHTAAADGPMHCSQDRNRITLQFGFKRTFTKCIRKWKATFQSF